MGGPERSHLESLLGRKPCLWSAVPLRGTISIDTAGLLPLIEKLPHGLQSGLGEAGSLVSGGEGQRVRFGRASARPEARLVILDEPFTALDREHRRKILARSRKIWRHATLLCITHDIAASRHFDRVLILEQGRIVETDRLRS